MSLTKVTYSMIDGFTVFAKDFGAVGDGVADDTAALQAAFDAGAGQLTVLEPNATYKCTGQVEVKGDVDGMGATLSFHSNTFLNALVFQNSQGSLKNFTIDGGSAINISNGLFVDADFVQTATCSYDLTIKNITTNSTANQSTTGALFFQASNASINFDAAYDIKLNVSNVIANSDGTPGTNRGVAKGIIVAANCTGTNNRVHVHDCKIVGVSSGGTAPAQDADGIHFTQADFQTAGAEGLYVIRDCYIEDCKKRGVKIQSVNTTVDNVIVEAANTLASFETYSDKTIFQNCKSLNGSGAAYTTSYENTKFIACYGESSGATVDLVRVFDDGDYAVFENCTFISSAAYATIDFGVMRIDDAENVRLLGCTLRHTSNLGCSLLLRDVSIVFIENCLFQGSNTGIGLLGSTGRLTISDTSIFALSTGFARTSNLVHAVFCRDCRIEANFAIDLFNSGGANAAFSDFDTVRLVCNNNGAFLAPGSKISNSIVTKNGAQGGTGILLAGNNGIARNNQIINFTTGILATFAINQEIADNVTVTCATTFDLTGSTPLVNTDNFSR